MRQKTLRAATLAGALLSIPAAALAAPTTATSRAASSPLPAVSSTLRAATTPRATTPTTARAAARVSVDSMRRHVIVGRAIVVGGRLRATLPSAPATHVAHTVALQVSVRAGRWITVDRDRTTTRGTYRLAWTADRTGSRRVRVRFGGDRTLAAARHTAGTANVYRRALASWYGPGLYGSRLACGGRLTARTLGVANKSLPCGTKVTLRYRDRTVRVPVVDRGPYVGAREFDLTAATKARLGFGSTGTVMTTR